MCETRQWESDKALKMQCIVRYSLLLISICLSSPSWATLQKDTVTVLKGAAGKEITIPCATDKSPQDGVHMFKIDKTEKQKIFYYYKDGTFSPETPYKCKVYVSEDLTNLNATFLNLTDSDIGLYWCEFNWEDKINHSSSTWLWVTEPPDSEKECPKNPPYYMMTLLVGCIVIFLLCLITFFYVILKVKGCFEYKKYTPAIQPTDSVYEDMKRSNLDSQATAKSSINPEYQSATHSEGLF
ncbi:uncharacterized protein LOC127446456 isoform X2 [Myxocyprinus asiaticus]|uniref:uncharacterized protein LOC127446456 isoform X2 n=1 Tax=Myxocyprinus asiaticus TaxID=70543 RepID=UPI0022223607|nr:uncharacterized protein LOC127446456 isoform X2 [Myxocyprinus asiaticus]